MVATVAAIEIAGLAGKLLLLAPFVVLLAVILNLYRPRRPQETSGAETTIQRAIADDALAPDRPVAEPDLAAVPLPAAAPAPAVDWMQQIRAAEAASDHAALPGLYLSLARDEIAKGQGSTAADHLRSSVRFAAKTRNAAIHAEARLELAELARASGDLTTACEHWQIARGLFRELSKKPELDGTESLMQRHGCPTDWVLNDF